MKSTSTLLFFFLLLNCSVLYAQPTPPTEINISISEAIGDGCGALSDCDDGLICFDVSLEIDQDGWNLQSYNIWMDYGEDNSAFSYFSDSSCNHTDGGDIDLDVFGKYRFLASNLALALEEGKSKVIHNFCVSIIDYSRLNATPVTPGGTHFNLVSAVNLVDQNNTSNAINLLIPSGNIHFVDGRPNADISHTIVFEDCQLADISITDTEFLSPRFNWSTGETTPYALDLVYGRYFVTITSGDGPCQSVRSFLIETPDSCLSFIHGKVHVQDTHICSTSSERFASRNQKIQISPIDLIVPTDPFGEFTVGLPPGSYSFTPILKNNQFMACPDSINVVIDSANSVIDTLVFDVLDTTFCLLELQVTSGRARAGRDVLFKANVFNQALETQHGIIIKGVFDSLFDFNQITVMFPIDSIHEDSHSIFWSIDSLCPGQNQQIIISIKPFTTTPNGSVLENIFMATTSCSSTYQFNQIVTASYDPNDKTLVNAVGRENENIFKSDSVLNYTIRFQNTGNDTAFSVIITDELSEFLDIYSFEPGPSSHDYSWRILPNRLLEFAFDPILLPYQSIDDDGSQGFVSFSINRNSNTFFGDTINNNAHIIFDFNEAILTNTVNSAYVRPEYNRNFNYEICFGDIVFDFPVFNDTIIYQTIAFFDFDSIYIHHINVERPIITELDSFVRAGSILFGKVIDGDTTFTFNLISQLGCDSTVVYNVGLLIGTADFQDDVISLFPNPFDQKINLEAKSHIKFVEILDYSGQFVAQERDINTPSATLSTHDLAPGLYMIHIETDKDQFVQKMIKLK